MQEKIKVLVVDDQLDLAKEIAGVVETDEGIEVVALAADGFEVYHHSRVSANDEGIALGQLVIADAMLRKEAL